MHNCIICESNLFDRVIELGYHPPADTFLKKNELHTGQKFYPLNCVLCKNCKHLQTEYIVSKEERYDETEYSYTSSNSKVAREHWDEYCKTTSAHMGVNPHDHIIEFGSNDGYLLQQFIKKDCKVTGIDPSKNMVDLSKENGVNTIHGFLDNNTAKKAISENGKAKVIIGNNVFNHIDTPNEAITVIKNILSDDGYFSLEVPYHKDLMEKFLFDTIYHEHVSYFSVSSLDFLFRKNNMYITKIERNDYHGGSLRVYVMKDKQRYDKETVDRYIDEENKNKIFAKETYKKFMEKIIEDKFNVLNLIYQFKKDKKKIAAVGAAAKGNTLLNFYKLDNSVIEFVTDSSSYKIGKYTPGSFLSIVDDDELQKQNIDIALILPWNIGHFLIEKIKRINGNLNFIIPGEKEIL